LIAPDRFLVRRAQQGMLTRVQTRHAYVRSLAHFGTRNRAHCDSGRLCRNRQNRFNVPPGHALTAQYHLPNSKNKTKPHSPDRVRRKR